MLRWAGESRKLKALTCFLAFTCLFLSLSTTINLVPSVPRPHPGVQLATISYGTTHIRKSLLKLIDELQNFCGASNDSGFSDLPLKCMIDDLEIEMLYFSIRLLKPKVVWEISPAHGFSTTAILNALEENGEGTLYSFDIIDSSLANVPQRLQHRWKLVLGDALHAVIGQSQKLLYPTPDFVFLDSMHTIEFGQFYAGKLLPALASRHTHVAMHDVYNPTLFGEHCKEDVLCRHRPSVEGTVVTDWLGFSTISKACNAWTTSPFKLGNSLFFEEMVKIRKDNGLSEDAGVRNNLRGSNPTIFFEIGCS